MAFFNIPVTCLQVAMAIALTTAVANAQQNDVPPYKPAPDSAEINNPVTFRYNEEMAEYPGLEMALDKLLLDCLQADPTVRGSNFGILQFEIGADGKTSKHKVLRSSSPAYTEAVLRCASKMAVWKPTKRNGVAVPITYTLPVRFVTKI